MSVAKAVLYGDVFQHGRGGARLPPTGLALAFSHKYLRTNNGF